MRTEAKPIHDTANYQMVSFKNDDILCLAPRKIMTRHEAMLHAAWLVTMADLAGITDVDLPSFDDYLKSVRNT